MSVVDKLGDINTIVAIIRTYFISIFTYYMMLKISNKNEKCKIIILIIYIITAIMSQIIEVYIGNFCRIIFLVLLFALAFSRLTKSDLVYSILVSTISFSINYTLYIFATIVSFIPFILFNIESDYMTLFIIITIYFIIQQAIYKIRKFKRGLIFLHDKLEDEYFNLIIFNISVPMLLIAISLPNYKEKMTGSFIFALVLFSIIMFITIQKSLQMYYKQKLLIQDLEETKKELQAKKKEIEELEKENLNFSKTSHTIAHRQKALEYKLQELLLKNETAEEIGINDKTISTIKGKMNEISKEISNKETVVELDKTGIEEIDDMLKYMQAESIKNKIDFQVQINGNIHHMTNNYINKEDLEILLADHIKNAIIAINHSNNTHRSIFVRLGLIDEIYSLYIYDSGIEFEKETLKNLGKKPSTTHKDEGGTGMGFMNTFDTLNKYKASMEIREIGKPSKDNYTKAIIIKFDNKNKIKINA